MLLLATVLLPLVAQDEGEQLALQTAGRIRISERSNLSTREDDRYLGLLNRQTTGYLTRSKAGEFAGRFFLYERVRRDMQAVARPVDRSFETEVRLHTDALFASDGPFPSMQSLMVLPALTATPGTTWSAPGWAVITTGRDEEPLRLPVQVAYRFAGREPWNGMPALRVEAQYATRYPLPPSDDPDAPVVVYDGSITSVTGSHRLTIMIPLAPGRQDTPPASGSEPIGSPTGSPSGPVSVGSGAPGQVAFLRDELEERYRFADGTSRTVRGHVLLFLSGLAIERQQRIATEIEEDLDSSQLEDITVDRTDTGIRLTLDALRFLPDQAALLPEERPRLDGIAAALRRTRETRFLIVGHTADVGRPAGQQTLSVERARAIARALAERGISRDRIDIEGRGATEPVASNASEEGRARNRRVEIYVVEE